VSSGALGSATDVLKRLSTETSLPSYDLSLCQKNKRTTCPQQSSCTVFIIAIPRWPWSPSGTFGCFACLAVPPQLIFLHFNASIWIPDSIASLDDLLSHSRTSMCGGEGASDLFRLLVQTPFPGDGRTQTSRHFGYSSYSSCRPSFSQLSLEQHEEAKLAP
jgi:hypothetical protein